MSKCRWERNEATSLPKVVNVVNGRDKASAAAAEAKATGEDSSSSMQSKAQVYIRALHRRREGRLACSKRNPLQVRKGEHINAEPQEVDQRRRARARKGGLTKGRGGYLGERRETEKKKAGRGRRMLQKAAFEETKKERVSNRQVETIESTATTQGLRDENNHKNNIKSLNAGTKENNKKKRKENQKSGEILALGRVTSTTIVRDMLLILPRSSTHYGYSLSLYNVQSIVVWLYSWSGTCL